MQGKQKDAAVVPGPAAATVSSSKVFVFFFPVISNLILKIVLSFFLQRDRPESNAHESAVLAPASPPSRKKKKKVFIFLVFVDFKFDSQNLFFLCSGQVQVFTPVQSSGRFRVNVSRRKSEKGLFFFSFFFVVFLNPSTSKARAAHAANLAKNRAKEAEAEAKKAARAEAKEAGVEYKAPRKLDPLGSGSKSDRWHEAKVYDKAVADGDIILVCSFDPNLHDSVCCITPCDVFYKHYTAESDVPVNVRTECATFKVGKGQLVGLVDESKFNKLQKAQAKNGPAPEAFNYNKVPAGKAYETTQMRLKTISKCRTYYSKPYRRKFSRKRSLAFRRLVQVSVLSYILFSLNLKNFFS